MSIIIHRDKTFAYNGRPYRVTQESDQRTVEWSGYSIEAILSEHPGDTATITEGFWRLSDLRDYLARAEAENWAYLPDLDGHDSHALAAEVVAADSASAWRDRQGDVWELGADGLMHTPETAPFSREHVEKKWGPLIPVARPNAQDRTE